MTTFSSDVAHEEQLFFTQADNTDESEERTLERREQSSENAKQLVANEEPSFLKTRVKEFTMIDGSTTTHSMNGIKANARIRLEQNVNLVLKNLKLKNREQPDNEVLMTTDLR